MAKHNLKAIVNFPVAAGWIGELVEDSNDLQLMMPLAEIPFNAAQWLAKLDHSLATLSFFVKREGRTVGHFAFLRVHRELRESTLGLVYLSPQLRGSGASHELIGLAEQVGQEWLELETMLLNVREFNKPAHRLYLNCGYLEYERSGDIIRMRKPLNPENVSK